MKTKESKMLVIGTQQLFQHINNADGDSTTEAEAMKHYAKQGIYFFLKFYRQDAWTVCVYVLCVCVHACVCVCVCCVCACVRACVCDKMHGQCVCMCCVCMCCVCVCVCVCIIIMCAYVLTLK